MQRDIQLGKYTFKEILGTANLYELLRTRGLTNLRTLTFEEDNPDGGYSYELYTCQEAFNKIIEEFDLTEKDSLLAKAGAAISIVVDPDNASLQQGLSIAALSALPANYEYFLNQSRSAVDILYHHVLVNAYYQGTTNNAGLDYEFVRSKLQSEHTYQAIGKMTLPPDNNLAF